MTRQREMGGTLRVVWTRTQWREKRRLSGVREERWVTGAAGEKGNQPCKNSDK